jgi:hypothetical protein
MKKFLIKVLYYFIPFVCLYGGYKVINIFFISGDLGAIGQIPFGKTYYENLKCNYLTDNLTIDTQIISYNKFQPAKTSKKILTFGDSFSQKRIYGYQNYLGHLLGNSIINIENGNVEDAIALLNSGIIDSTTCRIVIIETVDRFANYRLSDIDFERQFNPPPNTDESDNQEKVSELFNFCSFLRLHIGYDNPVKKHKLTQNCFDHYFSHTLFYINVDNNFQEIRPAKIEKAKENLILLNKKFAEKGIKLIFLIAADKYDVYRPFMTNNFLPVDTTTDALANLPDICVINTKSMLQDMVKNGEKDVYMVNDTHWSYKGHEAAAKKLAETIDALGILK